MKTCHTLVGACRGPHVMDVCVPDCPCWPRPGEAPFSAAEQDFLIVAGDFHVNTVDFMARMDDVDKAMGADRLRYLLSVPIRGGPMESMARTAWIRLDSYWTPDYGTAVTFARKMLQHGACLAVACFQVLTSTSEDKQPCWTAGSLHYPGRLWTRAWSCSPLAQAAKRPAALACCALVREGILRRKAQERRWYGRRARLFWMAVDACIAQ